MANIHGSQELKGHSPVDVCDAGSIVANIPSIRGVLLSMDGDKLHEGSKVKATIEQISTPIPGFSKDEIIIPMTVNAFEPGKLILIEGKTDDVRAALELHLLKLRGNKGTEVIHDLTFDLLGLNRVKKAIYEAAIRGTIESRIEEFSQQYAKNIDQYLKSVPVVKKSKQKTDVEAVAA